VTLSGKTGSPLSTRFHELMPSIGATAPLAASPCQECGACCGHSNEWPRFTLETDAELDRIPARLISANQSGMKFEENRCSALIGEIATWTSCSIYNVRPMVCRDCVAGDDACSMARIKVGLPTLPQN
jgi:uncharacterized protein